jgi:hypothetical protein
MKPLALLFAAGALAAAQDRVESFHIDKAFALTADPSAPHWKAVRGVVAANDARGNPTPGHPTEIKSRWTDRDIYFLFVCPYEQLFLKPNPSTTTETNELWNWDVAEVFISGDFKRLKQYKEYQVSPQGEWVDLAINREPDPAVHDWKWNSGYEVKARIDEGKKVWYGEMRIPFASFDERPPKAGNEMRINFYRLQGPGPKRAGIAWQPTNSNTYHVPEAFGRLVLVP